MPLCIYEGVSPGETLACMSPKNPPSWPYATSLTDTQRSHRRCLLNDNNDGTFSIKGEYAPRKPRSANAVVISRDPLDPNEPPIAATRGYRQTMLELHKQRDQSRDQGRTGSKETLERVEEQPSQTDGLPLGQGLEPATSRAVGDKSGGVVIPSDPVMATEFRAYNEWPGQW